MGAPAGQKAEVSIFDIFIFLSMRWKSNEAKGTPNVSIIKHSNESRRYASNSETIFVNFKYHITPENTKCQHLKFNNQRLKNKNGI